MCVSGQHVVRASAPGGGVSFAFATTACIPTPSTTPSWSRDDLPARPGNVGEGGEGAPWPRWGGGLAEGNSAEAASVPEICGQAQ